MSNAVKDFLKKRVVNGWFLFWYISGTISIISIIGMSGADLSTGKGISPMIQLSVRCAVPWLYIAFAASSVHVLFSSDWSA